MTETVNIVPWNSGTSTPLCCSHSQVDVQILQQYVDLDITVEYDQVLAIVCLSYLVRNDFVHKVSPYISAHAFAFS